VADLGEAPSWLSGANRPPCEAAGWSVGEVRCGRRPAAAEAGDAQVGRSRMDNVVGAPIPTPSTFVGLISIGLMGALGCFWRGRSRRAA